ncbi:MAG: carboxypeptidase regulatory-like domain-containing protein, partial [Bryobacteraceae bacterium]
MARLVAFLALPLAAQTLDLYSEFQRVDPFGQILEIDRALRPRELLSPIVARNAWTSFLAVVSAPPGKSYFLYVQTYPAGAFHIRAYKVIYQRYAGRWIPDALDETRLPSFGAMPDPAAEIPGQTARLYLIDVWVPPETSVGTVRLEVLIKSGLWTLRPMEVRVGAARAPDLPVALLSDPLPDLPARADVPARQALSRHLAGQPALAAAAPSTLRAVVHRNALQDLAIARNMTNLWDRLSIRPTSASAPNSGCPCATRSTAPRPLTPPKGCANKSISLVSKRGGRGSHMPSILRSVFVLCVTTSALLSQTLTSLNGVVTDPAGAAVPDATVTITSKETGARRESTSDIQGRYSFPQVTPGSYVLLAKKSGFVDVSIQNIRLLVSSPTTVNVAFEKVGAVSQMIEVAAEASHINTVDSTIGTAFGTKPITQLPFEGRNVARILTLQPGVSNIGDNDIVNGGSTIAVDRGGVVNGGRSDQANITLDGADVSDQQNRAAFTSVLRVTLDSVQEFRVTTTNANADASRGSGAQVAIVTRSGTNDLHGSAYYSVRNRAFNANTFFNNQNSTLTAPLKTPKLNRNINGFSGAGPLRKNKLFLFGNFEQLRDSFEESVVRRVPTATLRQGIVKYIGRSGAEVAVGPQELRERLGDSIGVSQRMLDMFRQNFPESNDRSVGDGINTAGFRFNAARRNRFNTYLARIDYVLNDNHRVFARGQLQNDQENGVPQFPGRAPNTKDLNNSKGLSIGWDATLRSNLFSSTRYGFTRQGIETAGIGVYPLVVFRNLDDANGLDRPFGRISPTHLLTQDFTWIKGAHTVQLGGSQRTWFNDRTSYANSFFGISVNASWMTGSGGILSAPWLTAADPIDARSRTQFQDNVANVFGLVTQVTSRYNNVPQGDSLVAQQPGTPSRRKFRGDESEIYIQDSWKLTSTLNMIAGVRYHYWPALYEVNGVQTNSNIPLSEWFDARVANANAGLAGQTGLLPISYVPAKGGRPYYDNLHNWSPRLSLAWSPSGDGGLRRLLFGGPGRTSIRAGWGLYYDVFGAGLARAFDATALGLSTALNNSSGRLTLAESPRFTGLNDIPQSLVTPPPAGKFPVEQPSNFAITNSIDDRLRAPYVMRWNLSVTREFSRGWALTGAYVASEGRRTLTSEDLATPLNIRDPQSGSDYFTAAQQLDALIRASAPTASVQRIPYWENMFPALARGGLSSTQVAYGVYNENYPDATAALEAIDRFCAPACSRLGRFAFYSPQYSYLRAIRS